eukprot:gene1160-684_t
MFITFFFWGGLLFSRLTAHRGGKELHMLPNINIKIELIGGPQKKKQNKTNKKNYTIRCSKLKISFSLFKKKEGLRSGGCSEAGGKVKTGYDPSRAFLWMISFHFFHLCAWN